MKLQNIKILREITNKTINESVTNDHIVGMYLTATWRRIE